MSAGGVGALGTVSVVVITRDRREQVLNAVGHLDRLPEQPPIILVDNASGDGTAAAVRRRFPAVTVVELGRNRGATARTVGVEAATTPYVAFSDDDSWWAPGALRRAAEHFDAAPRLGLLAARILVGPDERLDPVCTEMAGSPLPRRADLPGPSVLGFVACGSVVRRTAYLQAGGFDPVVFFFGEETVLAQDLAVAGWGLAYVDDVVAHHHPQPGPARAGRIRLQARNQLLSCWLRRPPRAVLRETAAMALAARNRPELRGALLDATRRLPLAWAGRIRLPARIEAEVRLLETAPAVPAPPVPAPPVPAAR